MVVSTKLSSQAQPKQEIILLKLVSRGQQKLKKPQIRIKMSVISIIILLFFYLKILYFNKQRKMCEILCVLACDIMQTYLYREYEMRTVNLLDEQSSFQTILAITQ